MSETIIVPMASNLVTSFAVKIEGREVIRCAHCQLNQFATVSGHCRKCRKPLTLETPKAEPEEVVPDSAIGGLALDQAMRDVLWLFRKLRRLTQSQLAARMKTRGNYISKQENGCVRERYQGGITLKAFLRYCRALDIDPAIAVQIVELRAQTFARGGPHGSTRSW
jgi:ribosome-binding protein aMBF1 (putative translation factor)